jgi:hypothetical protein
MGSSSSAPVQALWPKPGQQHALRKFKQFLKYQPNFKLAHELPHAKVLTMVQPMAQHASSA